MSIANQVSCVGSQPYLMQSSVAMRRRLRSVRIEVCKHDEMSVNEVCLVKGADTVGSSSRELIVSVPTTLRIVKERA